MSKAVGRFAIEREASVACDYAGLGRRIAEKIEGLAGGADDCRIDLVEAEVIAAAAVRRERSGAEAHDGDPPVRRLGDASTRPAPEWTP